MKFGLLDFDLTVAAYWEESWNHKALLNVGDAAEYLVVEQIYRDMNIQEEQMKRLSIPQLTSYRGECLVVALNIALDSYVGYNQILEQISPDIIPIFLGMSFTKTEFNQKQVDCLKAYSPIGCRDERSYLSMKALQIPCYLNGCTASILQSSELEIPEVHGKILFIDVPYGVLEHVPQEIKKDIIFLNQEIYCRKSEMKEKLSPSTWSKTILAHYQSKPRMVVSSRFHGAVLALANNLPAVITLEKYTFRFSWLQNYYPIHTEKNWDQIDWVPKEIDYTSVRERIAEVSKKQIGDVVEKNRALLELTDLQRSPEPMQEEASSNQVHYYQKTWEAILKTWDSQKEYTYGFWGVNDNAKALHALISEEYPKARLVGIYDMFQEISYEGIGSENPSVLKERAGETNFYVIVTAYLASRVALDVCDECGFPQQKVFLCNRDFLQLKDIEV